MHGRIAVLLLLVVAAFDSSSAFVISVSVTGMKASERSPGILRSTVQESEEERLRLDAEAMKKMAEHVKKIEEAKKEGGGEEVDRAAWKWEIRQRIWSLLERTNLAEDPRPVYHRIPNFKGAVEANQKLAALPEFQAAKCVKVNPDTPQRQIRYLTLESDKLLLVPQPRLRTGFFSALSRPDLMKACSSMGVKEFGRPFGINDTVPQVDLIVIGSVAVNPANGARLGKGEGFAELEYGMLRMLKVISPETPIVTSIRDEQLVDDIPADKLLKHDVPVDIICTPTQVIRTNTQIPKPEGIYWDLLSPEKLSQIKVLQTLKAKIEKDTGVKLPSGPSEVLPPVAGRVPKPGRGATKAQAPDRPAGEKTRRPFDMYVGNIPWACTEAEVRAFFEEKGGFKPTALIMLKDEKTRRFKGSALVEVEAKDQIEAYISAMDAQDMKGRQLVVRRANPT